MRNTFRLVSANLSWKTHLFHILLTALQYYKDYFLFNGEEKMIIYSVSQVQRIFEKCAWVRRTYL